MIETDDIQFISDTNRKLYEDNDKLYKEKEILASENKKLDVNLARLTKESDVMRTETNKILLDVKSMKKDIALSELRISTLMKQKSILCNVVKDNDEIISQIQPLEDEYNHERCKRFGDKPICTYQ